MATKKSAVKETAEAELPAKTAAKKTAAKTVAKSAGKKAAVKKTVSLNAGEDTPVKAPASTPAKAQPSHHDIQVQAYLLWERDGHKHGHHEHYWIEAERVLAGS